jgi:hypothetical protein
MPYTRWCPKAREQRVLLAVTSGIHVCWHLEKKAVRRRTQTTTPLRAQRFSSSNKYQNLDIPNRGAYHSVQQLRFAASHVRRAVKHSRAVKPHFGKEAGHAT